MGAGAPGRVSPSSHQIHRNCSSRAEVRTSRPFNAPCAPEPGRDAFHRVRDFAATEWDAVERVPTRFRGRGKPTSSRPPPEKQEERENSIAFPPRPVMIDGKSRAEAGGPYL